MNRTLDEQRLAEKLTHAQESASRWRRLFEESTLSSASSPDSPAKGDLWSANFALVQVIMSLTKGDSEGAVLFALEPLCTGNQDRTDEVLTAYRRCFERDHEIDRRIRSIVDEIERIRNEFKAGQWRGDLGCTAPRSKR